jgi:hypothetical protein
LAALLDDAVEGDLEVLFRDGGFFRQVKLLREAAIGTLELLRTDMKLEFGAASVTWEHTGLVRAFILLDFPGRCGRDTGDAGWYGN